jgi:hypothetical protein
LGFSSRVAAVLASAPDVTASLQDKLIGPLFIIRFQFVPKERIDIHAAAPTTP